MDGPTIGERTAFTEAFLTEWDALTEGAPLDPQWAGTVDELHRAGLTLDNLPGVLVEAIFDRDDPWTGFVTAARRRLTEDDSPSEVIAGPQGRS